MKQTQAAYRHCANWWHDGELLRRFVSDFMHAELIMMRRGSAGLPSLPWPGGLQLEADLGIDSLERYALATAISACLHLHESGADQALLGCTTLEQWIACASNGLDHYSAELSFKTSGSSGVPKCCPHKLDMLWQEACFFAAQLPHARRVIYTVPAHHIYGFLFSVLLPLACGPVRASLIDARNMLPMELIAQATEGDVIIGYPELWSAVARHAPSWPGGVAGVTSTAPCPRDVALQLTASGLYMAEVYGSSETAGVGWRTDARRPYVLLPHWRRSASTDTLLRQAPDGTELRCDCQDQIDWQGENSFVPVGRRDQAVQVGGRNVYPAQVAEMLKRHPGVSEAHVRLMRADEGHRLKAFVVAEHFGGAERLPDQLASWVRERLPPAARPVSFTVGAALPVNLQGKLTDWIISDGPGADGA
ncbi:AMP-binding protein [Janthinobacterium sp. UMAB-56]|uniref:AMP-binding protein n=1 Tax=Janthinobacterium sp. UMAB-56 TaxID=1365361 RepID=UPI001C569C80|nr:AMP-binding protein [Janthinobacterium sp. UMAB-56]